MTITIQYNQLPCWLNGKESAYSVGERGWIPGLGRSPGEGHGDSCLETLMDRGAWWVVVHGVTKSPT